MVYVIPNSVPEGVHPDLLALVWMLGTWQGNGHGIDPETGQFEFGQQIEFSTNGEPYLHYISQTYTLDTEGNPKAPLGIETGFWYPHKDATVDLVSCDSAGWAELWYGNITGPKIELRTDAVARLKNAETNYTAGQKLFGFVDEKLMWAWDRATESSELQPYMWAQLTRVSN